MFRILGGNVHDIRLLRSTLADALMRARGINSEVKEHLCMDKGYDSASVRLMVEKCSITSHTSVPEERNDNRVAIPDNALDDGLWKELTAG